MAHRPHMGRMGMFTQDRAAPSMAQPPRGLMDYQSRAPVMDELMDYRSGRQHMGLFAQDRDAPVTAEETAMAEAVTASEPPPVGQTLDTERYWSREDMIRHRGFGEQVQSTGDPEQDAAQMEAAKEAVYAAFPRFRDLEIQVLDYRRDDAVNQRLRENNRFGRIEFKSGWEVGDTWDPRSEKDLRDNTMQQWAIEGNLGQASPTNNATSGRGPYVPSIEVYEGMDDVDPETGQPKSLAAALFGDMLHQFSAKDPDGNYIEDRAGAPQFQALRDQLDESIRQTPSKFNPEVTQLEEDRRLWERRGNDERSFEDYWDYSGLDAWIRGYLSPDERDEMRRQDLYTDEQIDILDRMLSTLRGQD